MNIVQSRNKFLASFILFASVSTLIQFNFQELAIDREKNQTLLIVLVALSIIVAYGWLPIAAFRLKAIGHTMWWVIPLTFINPVLAPSRLLPADPTNPTFNTWAVDILSLVIVGYLTVRENPCQQHLKP